MQTLTLILAHTPGQPQPGPDQGDGWERPILPRGVRRGTVKEFIDGVRSDSSKDGRRSPLRVVEG